MQNFVQGGPPTINAPWLNQVDALLVTVFNNAATPAQALTALGVSATGQALFTAADQAAALAALGAGATGTAVFSTATPAAARTAIGAGATGSSLFTAATQAAALSILGITATGTAILQAADAAAARTALGITSPYDLLIPISNETTAIVAAATAMSIRSPRTFTLTGVKASLRTASSGGIPTVNIKKNGVTILSTLLTIDVGELTSVTAAVPVVISVPAIAADDLITFDIDIAGTGAIGLKVTLLGTLP